ncbi:MAG: hypothetical protein GQ570_04225 [Helicobacteraceae bacterium]|nr:hypothetical protein [Helicobacteraceae bacterium]
MAIGPIGNIIYVNQQTSSASSIVGAAQNSAAMQNVHAAAEVKKMEKEIVEVLPIEESKELDPDREHERQHADEEQERSDFSDKKEHEEEHDEFHLDIKV